MAKAIAVCTCKECGTTFETVAYRRNRVEADNLEAWIKQNFTLCPACYSKKCIAEEQARPLTLHVCLSPFNKLISLYWDGGTQKHKEEIKALGYRFQEVVAMEGGPSEWLGLGSPQKKWTKEISISEDDLRAELDAAKSFAEKVINHIRAEDLAVYHEIKKKEQAKEDLIAQIPKPQKPDIYPAGRWNQKIYGSPRNGFAIYVDGEKVKITAEEKELLERYLADMVEYREKIKAIRQAI